MHWRRSISLGIISILCVALVGFFVLRHDTPRLDRDWEEDQKVPAVATIDGDLVTISNVRNYEYRSETEYSPRYYQTTVKLSELEGVDFIVEHFGEIDIGAAHTFLSFGFADGQHIAISVEIRKEKGEIFSPVKGILNQYELMYVIADERDVIDLRVNHRLDDVYLYPTTASKEAAQELFLSMLNRAEKLMNEPEFYNTLTNNCTTNIVRHINEITGQKTIPFDYRQILPAGSDELAQSLGFIAPGISIDEAREKYQVNAKAAEHAGSPEFSRLIRERGE